MKVGLAVMPYEDRLREECVWRLFGTEGVTEWRQRQARKAALATKEQQLQVERVGLIPAPVDHVYHSLSSFSYRSLTWGLGLAWHWVRAKLTRVFKKH